MTYDRPATWQNPRVLGLLFLVFLVGAAAGAVVMRSWARPVPSPARGSIMPSGISKENTLQHFKRELNLSPSQAQQIELILDDFMKYMQNLQDQMDDVRSTGKQRILNVLTDEQKAKFGKVVNELQKPVK